MFRAISAGLHAMKCLLLMFLLLFSAGMTREGVALRQWDEAGTVMNPGDDRPWSRFVGIEALMLLGMLIWNSFGPGELSRGWAVRSVLARALVFRASAACLLLVAMISGFQVASGDVANAYRWMFAIESALVPLGFGWGAYLWSLGRSDAKPDRSKEDEFAF